jgi:error-prone DNA polymerase
MRTCIAPFIHYAVADEYQVYDVMTCARLGINVFEPHPERPVNDARHLRSEEEWRALLPYPDAFEATKEIIDQCDFNILPGYITPPSARLPDNAKPDDVLRQLCEEAFEYRYDASPPVSLDVTSPPVSLEVTSPPVPLSRSRGGDGEHSIAPLELERGGERSERGEVSTLEREHSERGEVSTNIPSPRALLEKELTTIAQLGLSDFFLVVKEIVDEARRRNIRCSGRGSAANSIVAYLLGITGVCPVRHHLLFERFLHKGRKGTPDIDVDFDSDRRNEIIEWMERRFGTEQTAMTATLITFRARMAIREVAKALGWPMETVNALSKAIPGYTNKELTNYRDTLAEIVGEAPLLDVLIRTATLLLDRPRHLGLHSGGMILSARPLTTFTPIQRSANGVSVVQFDKDDVEAMGLVKFDVLGLRMLACIAECVELIGNTVDIDEIPLDDRAVFEMIKRGETLGVFQIESQGQMHLLAQHQPDCFDDLVNEVALFRPGPLQSGMVNPYVRRRKGLEPVTYLHPDLEPLLKDTLGIVLFQEQILEIAHHFAGLPLDEADDFRAVVSKNRDPKAMAAMKDRFIQGAVHRGVDLPSAEAVYDVVSHFVGYGFCKSHAAAFAKTVYQSAWLKHYYPAEYMAAFMQHRPGMYNLMTLEEEAKRLGVGVALPDINVSGTRYSVEGVSEKPQTIRKPLTSIANVTEDLARRIVWERLRGPFTSVEDLVTRVEIHREALESIALSGALDALEGDARQALWKAGIALKRRRPMVEQKQMLFADLPLIDEDDIPPLPKIKARERLAYDYISHGAARVHPMTMYRRMLNDLEVRTIETVHRKQPSHPYLNVADDRWIVTVAGIVILRQSPPTAHGVLFVTIEDETGFVQCVVQPREREYFAAELRNAALIVKAEVHSVRSWRGLVVRDVYVLKHAIGGYQGHAMSPVAASSKQLVGLSSTDRDTDTHADAGVR